MANLYEELRQARSLVSQLSAEIGRCNHQFTEPTNTALEERTIDLGESIGSSVIWIRVQNRECETCGLKQRRTQYDPQSAWSIWYENP